MEYSLNYFKISADYILSKIDFKPEIALILGSCLGPLAEEIEDPVIIEYEDIPNFLISTVHAHAGKLILGKLNGKKIVCMSGRFHYYEGYDFEQLVIPIRVFHLLGVKAVILTNAAGATNTTYKPGDMMVIKDHIKVMGASPLRGPNVEEFGPRFFDISRAYTPQHRVLAKKVAKKLNMKLHEGVYFFWMGPQFESPAEVRLIQTLGGDAVGMSTVTETITAAHCGMEVLGLSLITNMGVGLTDVQADPKEVNIVAAASAEKFKRLVSEIIKEI